MIHQNRRKELLSQLGETDLVILSTNPEQIRNGDVSGAGWAVNKAYDNDPDQVWEARATSSLIIKEIAQ